VPIEKLVEFLDQNDVRYVTINHSKAYTAQEVAAAAHVPGRELAKPVMVRLDGEMAMAVLPASHQVDFGALAREAGAESAELASEREFEELFPDSELGAMPPFGNLYDLPVYVDGRLEEDEEIFFSAGSHSQLLRMSYRDYERLVKPRVGRFGRRNG
jgi:Ala-tRNA(Pro) deacylase